MILSSSNIFYLFIQVKNSNIVFLFIMQSETCNSQYSFSTNIVDVEKSLSATVMLFILRCTLFTVVEVEAGSNIILPLILFTKLQFSIKNGTPDWTFIWIILTILAKFKLVNDIFFITKLSLAPVRIGPIDMRSLWEYIRELVTFMSWMVTVFTEESDPEIP